jgi:hypothetical protein
MSRGYGQSAESEQMDRRGLIRTIRKKSKRCRIDGAALINTIIDFDLDQVELAWTHCWSASCKPNARRIESGKCKLGQ